VKAIHNGMWKKLNHEARLKVGEQIWRTICVDFASLTPIVGVVEQCLDSLMSCTSSRLPSWAHLRDMNKDALMHHAQRYLSGEHLLGRINSYNVASCGSVSARCFTSGGRCYCTCRVASPDYHFKFALVLRRSTEVEVSRAYRKTGVETSRNFFPMWLSNHRCRSRRLIT
jgi:hypothetical protein